jgi:hypothetical protein
VSIYIQRGEETPPREFRSDLKKPLSLFGGFFHIKLKFGLKFADIYMGGNGPEMGALGKIEKILSQAPDHIKEALKKEAHRAEKFASESISHACEVARSTVTYRKDALVAVASKEITSFYVGLLGRSLNGAEEKAVERLAKVLANEGMREA